VILVWTGGGTGTFYNVAAVVDVDSEAWHVATLPLSARRGDRAIVHSLWVDSDTIYVNVTRHTEDDANCCPSLHVRNRYVLDENLTLVEIDPDSFEEEAVLNRPGFTGDFLS